MGGRIAHDHAGIEGGAGFVGPEPVELDGSLRGRILVSHLDLLDLLDVVEDAAHLGRDLVHLVVGELEAREHGDVPHEVFVDLHGAEATRPPPALEGPAEGSDAAPGTRPPAPKGALRRVRHRALERELSAGGVDVLAALRAQRHRHPVLADSACEGLGDRLGVLRSARSGVGCSRL